MPRSNYDFSAYQKVTFHGDSFTVGLYASAEETTYRRKMINFLQASGGAESVVALNTTGAKMNAAATLTEAEDNVATFDPDLVVLAYGINDVSAVADPGDLAAAEIAFRAACQDVMAAYAGRDVIVGGVAWCGGWTEGSHRYITATSFNTILEEEAANAGYLFTDLWNGTLLHTANIATPSDASAFGPAYVGDNFHYGDTGHAEIYALHLATLTAGITPFSRSTASGRTAASGRAAASGRTAV